jgi:hypothetical protein
MGEDVTGVTDPEDSGARMNVRDNRVSRGIELLLAIVGVLIASSLAWVGTNINTLNTTVAKMSEQSAASIARLEANERKDDRQDDRLNSIDGRVYTLEGRALRGLIQEQSNGR